MLKLLVSLIIALPFAVSPAQAEMSEDEIRDELAALTYFTTLYQDLAIAQGVMEIMLDPEKLKTTQELTTLVRRATRPTNLADDLLETPGSGRILREVVKMLKHLADNSNAQRGLLGTRWEDLNQATRYINGGAGAISLVAEFVEAGVNNDYASAEDKLNSLAQVIKDIRSISSVGLSTPLPVNIYIGLLADAIEVIAVDAAKIENATRQKNEIIDMVRERLVGEVYPSNNADRLAEVLEEIAERRAELERMLANMKYSAAHQEIVEAEQICARRLGQGVPHYVRLRVRVNNARRSIRSNEHLIAVDRAELAVFKEMLYPWVAQSVVDLREQIVAERQTALNDSNERLETEIEGMENQLDDFNHCVKVHLCNPDVEVQGILSSYFPQYQRQPDEPNPCICEAGFFIGPVTVNSEEMQAFYEIDFEREVIETFNSGQVTLVGVTHEGQPSSSFGAELIDSVDGDAWWGNGSLSFTFEAAAMGGLPTHVGMVWTDGSGEVSLEAWGPCGYLGSGGLHGGFPDDNYSGGQDEDRFFAVIHSYGIDTIRIWNTIGGIEIDNLILGRKPAE